MNGQWGGAGAGSPAYKAGATALGATGAAAGDFYYAPELLQYDYWMQSLGLSKEQGRELLQYQRQRDDANREFDYWNAEKDYQAAVQSAKIYAGASERAAAMGAEADMYQADRSLEAAQAAAAASRYAADRALEGLMISEENKLKIAAANLNLEAKRIAAEEMGAPSDWRTQAGFLRGMGMTQRDIAPAAISAAGEALGPVAPELGGAAAPVAPDLAPAAPTAPSVAPQAVVGTYGPEVLTATPQGTQVQPIQRESAWWLRKQGVPEMQGGGMVSRYNWTNWMPGAPGSPTSRPTAQGVTPQAGGATAGARLAIPSRTGGADTFPGTVELQQRPKGLPSVYGARGPGPGQRTTAGTAPVPGTMHMRALAAGYTPYTAGYNAYVSSGGIHHKFRGAYGTVAGAGAAGGRAIGAVGAGGAVTPAAGTTAAGGTATPAGAGAAGAEPPYIDLLRSGAYIPLWEAWGGPRTKPEVGMDIPIRMPHEISYAEFVKLTPTEQQMAFADWEALGMAPDTAITIMMRSAPRGTATRAIVYG